MSRSLYVACNTCRERLWVGQGYGVFYSGEPETMENLGKFLFKHETTPTTKHELSFEDDNSNNNWYLEKWNEFKQVKE